MPPRLAARLQITRRAQGAAGIKAGLMPPNGAIAAATNAIAHAAILACPCGEEPPAVRRHDAWVLGAVDGDAIGVEHALAQLRANVVRDAPVEAIDLHSVVGLDLEAVPLEEAGRRVVGVREEMQHAERVRVLLEAAEQARADARALLLLAHDAEGNLEEAARAVRLENDGAEHAFRRLLLTHEHQGLVVGRKHELGSIRAPDERQRRVDDIDDFVEERHVLVADAVVTEHDHRLLSTHALDGSPLVLLDHRVDDVSVGDASRAEPRALGHVLDGRVAALLVVAADAAQPVAQEDLVATLRLAAAAERAVRIGLRIRRARRDVHRPMHLQELLERGPDVAVVGGTVAGVARLEHDRTQRPAHTRAARERDEVCDRDGAPRVVLEHSPIYLVHAAHLAAVAGTVASTTFGLLGAADDAPTDGGADNALARGGGLGQLHGLVLVFARLGDHAVHRCLRLLARLQRRRRRVGLAKVPRAAADIGLVPARRRRPSIGQRRLEH
eukprot:CAMPEP_0115840680 /NCGR_PEP_ID=MMETSP0287-20121206/6897_1 /TAXON_ID=412157 /ORGANISM="Chrysochromulina rotalis, Strain UIO044" /LENGTH=498 /DNA_ID=CAMNT_0003294301 /DNA_START=221 /DNA_END=1715 /DNA_ORIENTATION=-